MKNLRRILGQNEMTQRELAEKTGISLATINRYVRQRGNPGLDHLVMIASVLGCSLDNLVGFNQQPEHPTTPTRPNPNWFGWWSGYTVF